MSSIQVRIPSDGGNPRDLSRIRRLGDAAFHVDPYHEPWLSLRHALARMEFCLENEGGDPEEVDLEIDYDPNETQNHRPRWDIEGRDHFYVYNRNRWWRVDGKVEGCILKARFSVPPGETLVALSPAFGYGDYLRFIESLPESSYLSKSLWMRSAAGREVWMLNVTDPAVGDEEKIRVLIDCRKHAYETFSSFAIQGVLAFLLSGHPAANLDKVHYTILPMMNPDGVAEGWMYEPPKDDPVFAALAALDEEDLRPEVVVTMHNWVHRRYEDIRYGHVDDRGEPLVEAWRLFKGFMPAETEYGRAYVVDEDGKGCYRPARSNRRERHGWCCEVPWFGRDDVDPVQRARETGVKFIHAVVQTELRLLDVPGATRVPPYSVVYLSDLEWTEAGPRRPNFPPRTPRRDRAHNGTLMRLDNVSFDRGVSLVPSMRVSYELADEYDFFEAVVGIDDGCCYGGDPIRVDFIVRLDGREVWRSGPVGPGSRQRASVRLKGAKVLELLSLVDVPDGQAGRDDLEARLKVSQMLSANWADAKLIRGVPILHLLADDGIKI